MTEDTANVHEDSYNNDNNNKNDGNIFIWPCPFSAHMLEHLSPAPFSEGKIGFQALYNSDMKWYACMTYKLNIQKPVA